MILEDPEKLICKECQEKLIYITEPSCKKCGKSLDYETPYCYDCLNTRHNFQQGVSIFSMNDEIKKSIYRFKDYDKIEYAEFYASEIVRCYGEWIGRINPDAIIPIPLHQRKKHLRGYNQAELVAGILSKKLGIPMITHLLKREYYSGAQKNLSKSERKNNLKKAFKITPNKVQLSKIILLDDIYTTGNTVDAATKELRLAGIEQVYVISIGIGRGY